MQVNKEPKEKSILFLAQVPPPIHGVTRMSKQVLDLLNEMPNNRVKHMWAGSATSLDDIGQRSLAKYVEFAKLLASLGLRSVATKRDDIVYTTIAPHGDALLRDAIVIASGRLLGKRTIVHMHTRGIIDIITGTSLTQRFTAWALNGTELVTQSADVVKDLSNSKLFSRIHHLPNYVEDAGTPRLTIRKKLNLGFFGSLDRRKGVLRFLDILAELKNDDMAFHGYIAGRSTHDMTPEVIANYAEKLGIKGNISIAGFLPDDAAIKFFLRQLDLFIYPTDHDLAPLVLLEAMSHGVVPLAFDTGAIREILSPEFSDHVITNNLDRATYTRDFCRHIERYMNHPKLLDRNKKKARSTFLARHSINNFARELSEIIAKPTVDEGDVKTASAKSVRLH